MIKSVSGVNGMNISNKCLKGLFSINRNRKIELTITKIGFQIFMGSYV